MNEAEGHTELPWGGKRMDTLSDQPCVIVGSSCFDVAIVPCRHDEEQENAKYIIKCCNEYPALVRQREELLEALKDYTSSNGGGDKFCGHDFTCSCAWDKALAAIKNAT